MRSSVRRNINGDNNNSRSSDVFTSGSFPSKNEDKD